MEERGPGSRESRAEEGRRRGRSDASSCMDAGPFELTRHKNGPPNPFSSVIRDGGQLQKPSSPVADDHRARSSFTLRKGHIYEGHKSFLYILDPGRSFFHEPFFPFEKRALEPLPFRATVAFLSFPSSFLLFLSCSIKGAIFFFLKKERIFLLDVVRDIFYLNFGNFIQCSFIDRCPDTIFFFK